MTLNMELATAQDAAEIRRVLEEANLPAEDVSLAAPQSFFVLRRGAEIRGVAGVELYGSAALLRSVCVVDSAAGAGLGDRLPFTYGVRCAKAA